MSPRGCSARLGGTRTVKPSYRERSSDARRSISTDRRLAPVANYVAGLATSDVIDASVALAVAYAQRLGDEVTLLTSDSDELRILLSVLDALARIVEV